MTLSTTGTRRDAVEHRQTILETATRVFSRDGFDVPLDVVIKEAGLGRGTLYRHFPNRTALALAVMEREIDRVLATAKAMATDPLLLQTFLREGSRSAPMVLAAIRDDPDDWKTEVLETFEAKVIRLYELIVANAIRFKLVSEGFSVEDLKLLRAMMQGVEQYLGDPEHDGHREAAVSLILRGLRP